MHLALVLAAFVLVAVEGSSLAHADATDVHVRASGHDRTYRFVDPAPGTPGRRPVVVALHGGGGSGAMFEHLSGWTTVAAAHGALAVYPNARTTFWKSGPRDGTDVGFLTRVLDRLARDARVDPARIYLTGHSSGAFMTVRLACLRGDRIAAAFPVAGGPSADCPRAPARPVPLLSVHGEADGIVPYGGGNGRPSARGLARRWVRWNRCAPGATASGGAGVRTLVWHGCAGGAEVRLVSLAGWNHHFPTRTVGAPIEGAETGWAFLRRFSRGA